MRQQCRQKKTKKQRNYAVKFLKHCKYFFGVWKFHKAGSVTPVAFADLVLQGNRKTTTKQVWSIPTTGGGTTATAAATTISDIAPALIQTLLTSTILTVLPSPSCYATIPAIRPSPRHVVRGYLTSVFENRSYPRFHYSFSESSGATSTASSCPTFYLQGIVSTLRELDRERRDHFRIEGYVVLISEWTRPTQWLRY